MTESYYYGDLTRREQRNVDRNRSRENAETSSVTDDEYMRNLGKEGTKRQQEHMLSRAEDVAADYDAADYMKSHGYGKTKRKAPRRKR